MAELQDALVEEIDRREEDLRAFRKALEAMGGSTRTNGQAQRRQPRTRPQVGAGSTKDKILMRLAAGPATAQELKAIAGSSYGYHMPRLKKAGVVKKVRGNFELVRQESVQEAV